MTIIPAPSLPGIRTISALLSLLTLAGCGGGSETFTETSNEYGGEVQIDLRNDPIVEWDAASGKTSIVIQFVPRGADEEPLTPEDVNVSLLVNDQDVDVESLLQSDAQELSVNINYGLVLDTSYSMLTAQDPPAFEPMLSAARDSINEGLKLWENRAGNFNFTVSWFDEYVYLGTNNNSRSWQADDVLAIPVPLAGTATKLYAATAFMAEHMSQHDAGNQRHHDVVVVFSDGADNYSWFANEDAEDSGNSAVTKTGASYTKYGQPAYSIDDAVATLEAHTELTAHVIGLGTQINEAELKRLAEAGNGLYLQNPQSTQIARLFERVTKEFTTLQTKGAKIPLPPGDYTFKLVVSNKRGSQNATYSFGFHAGDADAAVLE